MLKINLDGWLLYDFRGNNPVFSQILPGQRYTSRRSFLMIPALGEPIILVSPLDSSQFQNIRLRQKQFRTWAEMHMCLREILQNMNRIAMEYVPEAEIPAMSIVDAGTIELVRSFGVEVVTSADIYQIFGAVWPSSSLESHIHAARHVDEIKEAAFRYIAKQIQEKGISDEYEVQKFIMDQFIERGLETEDRPIVAVNKNSSSPHYEPSSTMHSAICPGDWVLIDLWARVPGEQNVFADITWVGFVGTSIPKNYLDAFEAVRKARDAVITEARIAWDESRKLQGWQLDEVAYKVLSASGYEKNILHRTGHSIGPGKTLHALGVNLDNFETRDTRSILPGVGFSVEPGVYLNDFGVRSEINIFVDPVKGPIVTTRIQQYPILIG